MTPRLALERISKSFPGVTALADVSFDVRPGEVHALIGENGAGKSTLLKILSGVYHASAGVIRIDGQVREIANPRQARDCGIALIHQELQQISELDVAQNMFLGSPHKRFGLFTDKTRMRREAAAVLERLDPTIKVTTRIRDLRVAQRQIVEIAKALLAKARIIAMDEPTSSLTPRDFETLKTVIDALAAQGVAVIYVSHKLDEVFRVATRATVLRDGRRVGSLDLEGSAESDLVSLMVGRALGPSTRKSHARPEILLAVDNLSRGTAVRQANFSLHAGEILGIAGLVGAGRTELVRLIAGIDRRDGGNIALKGKPLALKSPRDAIAAGIALLPEDRKREGIIPLRPVATNVALPRLGRLSKFGLLDRAAIRATVRHLTERVVLRPPSVDRPIRLFSGGNQQKAIICRWLMAKSDILIFDEPTRGIDVGAKSEIYQLIEALAEEGRGIIVVSSDLPEILRLADRVLVVRRGKIAGTLAGNEITEESIMRIAV